MDEMTHRERIQAALHGDSVDRVPVAFWRHWPIDDQDAESMADRALDYQWRFDFDFIKIPPSHTFCVADYGVRSEYRGRSNGDRHRLNAFIKQAEDLDRIEPLDVYRGQHGMVLRCLRRVLERRDPEIPVIQTCFNPMGMLRYLCSASEQGETAYLAHMRRHPERVLRALETLAETGARFVRAVMDAGADGIFLSTSAASYLHMGPEEYDLFGRPGDLAMLQAAADGWFNIMHVCQPSPMVAKVTDYPVQALNWHDRAEGPSLSEVASLFPGAVVGGVEQHRTLHFGTADDVQAQVHDAITQMGGRRLIVAAGCTYQLTVPEGNLIAARQAVGTPGDR
jgi:uroporphyrinogen decarboxylase